MFECMKKEGLKMNQYVLDLLIITNSKADELELATEILDETIRAKSKPSNLAFYTLLCGFARKSDIDYLCQIIETCKQKNIIMQEEGFIMILQALADSGHGQHIKRMEKVMHQYGFFMDDLSSKRLGRKVRVGGTDIGPFVAGELQNAAKQCAESMDVFSKTVESLLLKHGKGITERQFQLARVADCAIDIYAMVSILSRASRAVRLSLPSANQEVLMSQIWCKEASNRVQRNVHRIDSVAFNEHYRRMAVVAKTISERQGVAHQNPLEVN
uniref:ACAD9/ACADV-like C-terminal domain-containing protein n=1 Tax=Anopheles atroparvus TaxID=41427 RepID=A0A182JMN4_ANOAO